MFLLDFIFPKFCLECGKGNTYICTQCLQKVKKPEPFCPVCAHPSTNGVTHEICKTKLSLDGITCLYCFDGVVRKAIMEIKYNFVSDAAGELSDLCFSNLKSMQFPFEDLKKSVIVPIPLHKSKERRRGFNQSVLIGKHLAKKIGCEINADLLIKIKSVKSQTELNKEERFRNVKGVFVLNPKYSKLDANYIVFDDVWTTGSTLKEACKVLKRNGAETVWGLTIAS